MASVTGSEHPTLDFEGAQRISRTAVVTAGQFDSSEGLALARAGYRCRQSVEERAGLLVVGGAFWYITYEVVIDVGNEGPMWSPLDGEAEGLVLPGVSEGGPA